MGANWGIAGRSSQVQIVYYKWFCSKMDLQRASSLTKVLYIMGADPQVEVRTLLISSKQSVDRKFSDID